MLEPADKSFVLVGSLADSDPWDVYVYARDDGTAKCHYPEYPERRWLQTGVGEGARKPVTWADLQATARAYRAAVTVLAAGDTERP